ncbi:hypothetical protein Gpo141_00009972 [Globisporangium polare]
MFCKKLVLIAATAALAFGSISASQQGKVHVRVHAAGLEKGLCDGQGQSPMSVEGVDGVFCVSGQACVANISNGACPGPQSGLPNGAVCGVVKTGVYGCKPAPASPTCTGNDVTPMSVEGVAGIFCVNGKACAGQDGACPGPQSGLPNGAYCGTVKTGVLGCKPKGTKHHKKHKSAAKAACPAGQSPMSVEGVEGVFCVSGQACAGVNGSCPGPQANLPNGAVCAAVKTGVLGCKPAPASPACTGNDVTPMSVEGVAGIFCVNGKACAGQDGACPGPQSGLPNGAYCGTVKTGVLGCKPKGTKHHKKHKSAAKAACPAGQSPMSVEGVAGVFCVGGKACAGQDGACPGPQSGLPNGASCGTVKTGVLGCKPNAAAPVGAASNATVPAKVPGNGTLVIEIEIDDSELTTDDSEDSEDSTDAEDSTDSEDSEDSEDARRL